MALKNSKTVPVVDDFPVEDPLVEDLPDTVVEETVVEEPPDVRPPDHIRVEGGGFTKVGPDAEFKLYRQSAAGVTYEHVADHPSGDWVYRPTR